MRIGIEEPLFTAYPGYVRHVVIAEGLDNGGGPGDHPDLAAALRACEANLRTDPAFQDLKAHPRLASWREAFQAFGANPNKCPPSICNLLKRVRGGAELPFINPLVCLFNILSLRYLLPAGGDDLDQVQGDLVLAYAQGTETYTPLGRPGEVERPFAGEVILVDRGSQQVACRSWCWKNGHPTRIEATTRRAAINPDALPPIGPGEGLRAAEDLAALLTGACGGRARIERLDADRTWLEIPAEVNSSPHP